MPVLKLPGHPGGHQPPNHKPEGAGQIEQEAMGVVLLCVTLHANMQTQKNCEGQGLVKSEFQDCLRYLIIPLIKKDVIRRAQAGAVTFSGKPMHEVKQEWADKLDSSFKLLEDGMWQSHTVKAAKQALKTAEKKLTKAEAKKQEYISSIAHLALVRTIEIWQQRDTEAQARADEMLMSAMQHGCTQEVYDAAYDHVDKATIIREALDDSKRALAAIKAPLQAAVNKAMRHVQAASDALDREVKAYKPTSDAPFFLTFDNCPSYSVFSDNTRRITEPNIPMLQVSFLGTMICVCACVCICADAAC